MLFIIILLYNYRCCSIKNCDYPWSCNRGHAHHHCLYCLTIHLNNYDFAEIQAGSQIGARSSPGQNKGTASNLWGNYSIAGLSKIVITTHWRRREYSICISCLYECLRKDFYINKTVFLVLMHELVLLRVSYSTAFEITTTAHVEVHACMVIVEQIIMPTRKSTDINKLPVSYCYYIHCSLMWLQVAQ